MGSVIRTDVLRAKADCKLGCTLTATDAGVVVHNGKPRKFDPDGGWLTRAIEAMEKDHAG